MAELKTPNHFISASQKTQKFSSNLLHRAFFVVLLVFLLPLFPSEAPEFLSQSVLSASWELVHLLFVGIAISYGLFCRRSAENSTQTETPSKPESPQSYVSKVLHFSSVFNDGDDSDSSHDAEAIDDTKFDTWSSQYGRNASVAVTDEIKPLLLPVRSLKSSTKDTEILVNDAYEFKSSSGQAKGPVVLRSPIPWRSRTEMTETSDDSDFSSVPDVATVPSKIPSFRYQNASNSSSESTRSSYQNVSNSSSESTRSSYQNVSNSSSESARSSSPERRAKFSEDTAKRKSFKYSVPPPPPPPPPPIHGYHAIFDKKVVTKSLKDELKDLSLRAKEGLDHSTSAMKPRISIDGSSVGKSVRTSRPMNLQSVETSTNFSSEEKAVSFDTDQMNSGRRNEDINELFGKIVVSSDDSDTEDGDNQDVDATSSSEMKDVADKNEVDKKAEEFIAKFREQIRLQRIDSIKRSTGQRGAKKQL